MKNEYILILLMKRHLWFMAWCCQVPSLHYWRTEWAHCGLLIPYDDIELGQHCFRVRLVVWQHQAITWNNVDLSVEFCGTHLTPISQEVLKISIYKMSFKNIIVKLLLHLSVASETELSLCLFTASFPHGVLEPTTNHWWLNSQYFPNSQCVQAEEFDYIRFSLQCFIEFCIFTVSFDFCTNIFFSHQHIYMPKQKKGWHFPAIKWIIFYRFLYFWLNL